MWLKTVIVTIINTAGCFRSLSCYNLIAYLFDAVSDFNVLVPKLLAKACNINGTILQVWGPKSCQNKGFCELICNY